jgi:broad specificity phosphatase PhoE
VTEILLARHGETDWNLEHRVQGHTDRPLNATGLEQARALAAELGPEPLVAVYASDLVRARDTAVIVAKTHGLDVVLDPDLREKNFGSWEGLTDVEIRRRFPDASRGRWGDAETTEVVAARTIAAIDRIRAVHPSDTVLAVSHGGPLRAILAHLAIEHGAIGNCDVFRISS